MVMSSKKIGKMVTADVDKALANIGSTRPDMKADDAITAAVAPKKAPSFAEAFRAARAAGDKTFTWGGKSFAAKMAGEGASRPATTRSSTPAVSTASASASPATSRAQMEAKRTAARSQEAIRDKRAENQADFRERMQAKRATESRGPVNAGRFKGFLAGMFSGDAAANYAKSQEKKYGKSSGRPLLLVGEEARRANKGTIGGYAKGGKIDGCAIRGKTRAIKKGK